MKAPVVVKESFLGRGEIRELGTPLVSRSGGGTLSRLQTSRARSPTHASIEARGANAIVGETTAGNRDTEGASAGGATSTFPARFSELKLGL